MTKAHYKPRNLMTDTNVSSDRSSANPNPCNRVEAQRVRPTIAPHVNPSLEPDASESSDTILVDQSYLDALAAEAPPSEEADIEFEVENAPLPAAQAVGGYVISAEYMRRIMVYARRERVRRLGAKHP